MYIVVSVFCLRIQDEELQDKKQEKKSKTRLEHVTRTALATWNNVA